MITFESKYLTIDYDDRLLRNFEIDSIVIQFVPDFLENFLANSIIRRNMYVYQCMNIHKFRVKNKK